MKKIILALTLSVISLYANIEQVQTYYDSAQFEEAITEAKASKDEYGNPELHLLWAKSAEKLGHEEEAMSAYERVEMLDENNIPARVALVKLYKRTGRDDLARAGAKDLQNYQLTPEQRTSLNILRGINLHSVKAYAALAFGYDTNINVAADEVTGGSSNEALGTAFEQLSASVSYTNELEDKGGWYGRGDLQVYNQTNFASDAGTYDLFLGGISAGAGFVGDGFDVYVPLGYDTVHYLEHSLLSQIKLQPRVNYIVSNELIANAELSYVSRSYTDSLTDRDDSAFGLGAGLYYLLDKDYVFAKAKYENYSGSADVIGQYVDKNVFSANAGINYNISPWLVLKADYRFRLGSFDTNERSDFFNQLEIKFSHYFADMFEAYASNTYASNGSNDSAYEYSKNILMFGVALNY